MLPRGQRTTALIVEDDPALRVLYRLALSAAGLRAITVEDGVDALQWAEATLPSVVVLDISLPRLSGRDVYNEFRSRRRTRDVPFVVVTGTDPPDLSLTDIDCLLAKPVDPDRLVDAVHECLRRARRAART